MSLALAVRSVLGAALLAAAPAPATTAKVSLLEGSATRTAGGKAEPLAQGAEVHAGDELATSDGSRLELVLEDGSVIRVGPKSQLVVQELRYDGESTLNARLKLLLGAVWAHVEHLSPSGTFEVQTERAVAGVRGTEFRVDSDAAAGAVEVYQGKVAVKSEALAMAESPAVHEALVEPGHRLELAAAMRMMQAREPDAFDQWAKRELPRREAFFEHRKEREDRRQHRREKRQERRERRRNR